MRTASEILELLKSSMAALQETQIDLRLSLYRASHLVATA